MESGRMRNERNYNVDNKVSWNQGCFFIGQHYIHGDKDKKKKKELQQTQSKTYEQHG